MTTVAVLYGGTSGEREVSLRSGTSVAKALKVAGYEVKLVDPAPLDHKQLSADLEGCDVVFPVLHGEGGEDGKPQQWLEDHGFAYVGADSVSSAVCFDKARYKQMVSAFGVRTAQGELVTPGTIWNSELTKKPYVLKPNDGGSSVDTFIVRDIGSVDKDAIEDALEKYQEMLLEELIDGREITVAVVADAPLPVIEIIPPADGEFDYENKYNGRSQELCPPENVSESLQKQAQQIALKIHRQLRVRDMSRTDLIIRSGDHTLFVLETNTIPGMTDQSLLPKAASVAGMSMPDLTASLVEAALKRTN